MKTVALHLLAAALSAAIVLAAYHLLVARPAQRVGIVDVGEIYRAKEAEFTQMVTKPGSDAEREKALAMAQRFARRLPVAMAELQQDCGCLVLAKASVIAAPPDSVDLTALLRRKVEAP